MNEEELKAYQGLKKQGAFLFKSPKSGLVVAAISQPNLTVTFPIPIPVTTSEYINRKSYVPTYYQEPNILKEKVQLYQQGCISNDISGIILFRRK